MRLAGLPLAQAWRELLTVLARSDAAAIQYGQLAPPPPLYGSGVRYADEPGAGSGLEDFADPWTVHQRGWGDCDDLIRYRLCELYISGELTAAPAIHEPESELQHAAIRRADGSLEDPSLNLLNR